MREEEVLGILEGSSARKETKEHAGSRKVVSAVPGFLNWFS